MDWVPIVFVAFKVLVFGTAMFFAIKWHYDQGKSKKEVRAVLRTSAAVVVVFVLSAVGVVFATFTFAKWLGMDLNFP
jgi:uncharacterized membrane protein YidH (DUF202 family)